LRQIGKDNPVPHPVTEHVLKRRDTRPLISPVALQMPR
jgi:hypothetical protein